MEKQQPPEEELPPPSSTTIISRERADREEEPDEFPLVEDFVVEGIFRAAAAASQRQVLAWIPPLLTSNNGEPDLVPPHRLVYASHGVLHVATCRREPPVPRTTTPSTSGLSSSTLPQHRGLETIWQVQDSLRTCQFERPSPPQPSSTSTALAKSSLASSYDGETGSTTSPIITCMARLEAVPTSSSSFPHRGGELAPENNATMTSAAPTETWLVVGFSHGEVHLWREDIFTRSTTWSASSCWREGALLPHTQDPTVQAITRGRAITALHGIWWRSPPFSSTADQDTKTLVMVVAATSAGAVLFRAQVHHERPSATNPRWTVPLLMIQALPTIRLCSHTAMASVGCHPLLWPTTPSSSTFKQEEEEEGATSSATTLTALIVLGTASPRHNRLEVYHTTLGVPSPHDPDQQEEGEDDDHVSSWGHLTGHEDWIGCMAWWRPAGPAVTTTSGTTTLGRQQQEAWLASGSQDARIRLWKWTTTAAAGSAPATRRRNPASDRVKQDPAPVEDDEWDIMEQHQEEEQDEEGEARLEVWHGYGEGNFKTSVVLEAVLVGHEQEVTSVCWHPQPQAVFRQDAVLISSSMDRTIFLWCPAVEDGIWTPISRVGGMGGILGGSVGSSLLGFMQVTAEPSRGRHLIGNAYGGALHLWQLDASGLDPVVAEGQEAADLTKEDRLGEHLAAGMKWKATPCITGHFRGVVDLSWEPTTGDYLLTVSLDQTCRLWAPVGGEEADSPPIWVELARPQVHGYDLTAVASLSTPTHPHLLVSAADEKELRVFDAPKLAVRLLAAMVGTVYEHDAMERVERAYIPSLGLSNKASASEGAEEELSSPDASQGGVRANTHASEERIRLPLERDLGAVSLWPETRKLFGHDAELFALASNMEARTAAAWYTPLGQFHKTLPLLASTTKARNVEMASIRLWNVEQGTCVQILAGGHKATIAAICFSPDGRYIVSSGKDRRLCLWRQSDTDVVDYSLAWAKEGAHKRIVWSAHFCPFNCSVFATGSRDGTVKVWRTEDHLKFESPDMGQVTILAQFSPSFQREGKADAVTALSLSPVPFRKEDRAFLALGLESGRIELWSVGLLAGGGPGPSLCRLLEPSLCHMATVTQLAWRPLRPGSGSWRDVATIYLASCSMDHSCRILEVKIGH